MEEKLWSICLIFLFVFRVQCLSDAPHVRQRVSCWFDSRSIKASRCHANAHLCIWVICVFRLRTDWRGRGPMGARPSSRAALWLVDVEAGGAGLVRSQQHPSPRRSSRHLELCPPGIRTLQHRTSAPSWPGGPACAHLVRSEPAPVLSRLWGAGPPPGGCGAPNWAPRRRTEPSLQENTEIFTEGEDEPSRTEPDRGLMEAAPHLDSMRLDPGLDWRAAVRIGSGLWSRLERSWSRVWGTRRFPSLLLTPHPLSLDKSPPGPPPLLP